MSTQQKTIRDIIQQRINFEFSLNDRIIQRQTTTVIEVSDGAESRVIVRGATNLSPEPWAIYEGQYGKWQAPVSKSMRVGTPHPIF